MAEATPTTILGTYLRRERKERGLNQPQLGALAFGTASATQLVSNYERGVYVPEADKMAKLIMALELPPGEAWEQWGLQQMKDPETMVSYSAYMISAREPEETADLDVEVVAAGRVRAAAGDVVEAARSEVAARRRSERTGS